MPPPDPRLSKQLDLRLEHLLVQPQIIHDAHAHKLCTGKGRALAVHERAARLAKGVGHRLARVRGMVLSEVREVVLPPGETGVRVERRDVCREH